MDQINHEAWSILSNDERTAITLSLGYGKSTWEGGEILNKAHFKYLEIQKRSVKFLEIFTNHFHKYGGLFPHNLDIPTSLKEYLSLTILQRKNISQAVNLMDDPSYIVVSRRNAIIIRELKKLANNNSQEAQDLYSIIMDFDRWNNFRILPVEIQEPSAFKRRNKSRNIKHLNTIISLPHFSVLKIIERYSYSGRFSKKYLPIISPHLDEGYKIITIKNENSIISDISKIGLFIFDENDLALEFSKLVSEYFIFVDKTCKKGQSFWPEFRSIINRAFNYMELENIHRSRLYLDMANFDREKLKQNIKDKPIKGEDRVNDEKMFYNQG